MGSLKSGTRPPWVGLGAAVWVQIASGNSYNFPLYSHSLKSVLGFSQHQLTLLGVANDFGENFGLLPGFFCDRLPPWVVLLIGAVACFSGYGVLWLALSRTVQSPPYWLLWVALCVASHSCVWFDTAILVINMRNFPADRGTVAGILKGYCGLSAAVFTEIYGVMLHHSSSRLLLFLSLGVPVSCFITMYFIRPCVPPSSEDPSKGGHFMFIQATSVALGLYVLTTTILNDLLPLTSKLSNSAIAVMVLLLLAPLAVPLKMTFFRSSRAVTLESQYSHSDGIVCEGSEDKSEPLLTNSSMETYPGGPDEKNDVSQVNMHLGEGEGEVAAKKKRRPKRGEDFNFFEALLEADFWLLFLVYFIGVGTGVTVLNNMAQIGIAQGVHDTTILMSLFSFCNFVGRLGGGVVSEHFLRSKIIPRTVWMTLTQVIIVITCLLFASAADGTLYAATSLLGICYGVQVSVMIPTVSELFGMKHFGLMYNFISLGNPLGALLFSGLLAGYIYDNEAAKQHGFDVLASTMTCLGPDCFRLTFLILAAVCGFGVIMSLILTIRIKPFYKALYAGGLFRLPQSSTH